MSNALKYETISTAPGQYNGEELYRMQEYIRKSFPLVFNSPFIETETVNNYSLLFTIKGSDPSLSPFMLTSHIDVVPVDSKRWLHPPFSGEIFKDPETGENCLWGRGAIDDKSGVVGILSAIEHLLSIGWTPTRSFYVGFGHDEEVSGFDGAGQIAKILTQRNVSLDFLLDEGMPIVQGLMQGIDAPIALIGVTEKGRMDVQITAEGVGGHSSIPPKEQAVEKLVNALANLYKYPQPSMFGSGPETDLLYYLAPKASWPFKLLFANIWLFGPLLSYGMSLKSQSDALLRTTTAVTVVKGGVKENVVPATASAIINHRIHPSQSLEDVLQHDRYAIGDDNVKVEMLSGVGPHPVSPFGPSSLPYKLIAGAVKRTYPEAIIAPSMMIANTDTRYYLHQTDNIYRFIPILLNSDSLSTIHGDNERIRVSAFKKVISFYLHLIQTAERISLFSNTQTGRQAGEL